ncbi:hypothetical protein F5144DRAFT_598016 [Chaetomium tenue]|uniref:Uncharacterized protein n=1 Tax=Chaetomium tenue TaxID=1854479 RepID=A0ACB7PN83_9PEZI|nr:hypothetical protein F5144DRAFT_598016 [Chaetomium globosum]
MASAGTEGDDAYPLSQPWLLNKAKRANNTGMWRTGWRPTEPPEGEVSDFSDRGALVPAIIAVCSFMMALALVTTGGRLYANRKQLALSDYFCTAGLVFAVTETTLMFFRGQNFILRAISGISRYVGSSVIRSRAVIATTVSLVYRIRLWANSPDKSWKAAIVLLCSVVELHITIIVSSMPGFSKFVRVYFVSKRKKIRHTSSEDSSQWNTPGARRDRQQYLELGESWLFRSDQRGEEPADNTPGPRPTTTSGTVKTLNSDSQAFSKTLPDNVMIVRGIAGEDVFRVQGVERE